MSGVSLLLSDGCAMNDLLYLLQTNTFYLSYICLVVRSRSNRPALPHRRLPPRQIDDHSRRAPPPSFCTTTGLHLFSTVYHHYGFTQRLGQVSWTSEPDDALHSPPDDWGESGLLIFWKYAPLDCLICCCHLGARIELLLRLHRTSGQYTHMR